MADTQWQTEEIQLSIIPPLLPHWRCNTGPFLVGMSTHAPSGAVVGRHFLQQPRGIWVMSSIAANWFCAFSPFYMCEDTVGVLQAFAVWKTWSWTLTNVCGWWVCGNKSKQELITTVIAAILLFNFSVLVWHWRALTGRHGPTGRTLSKCGTKQRSLLLGACNLNIPVCWLLTRNPEVFEPSGSKDPSAHTGLCQRAVGLYGCAMVLLTQVAQPGGGTGQSTCICRWGNKSMGKQWGS